MTSLLSFLDQSKTAYHAANQAKQKLKKAGFKELFEQDTFKLKAGSKYYVCRDGGSLIAFIVPQKPIEKARVLLSHLDSPSFRLKPNGEYVQDKMLLAALEVYGGPIYASWYNRDLAFAGRIFVEKSGKIEEILVDLQEHPVVITDMPIHLNRTVNSEGLKVSAQKHLNALIQMWGDKELKQSHIEKLLKKKYKFQTLLNHELYLYPLENARLLAGDLVSSARIDNLFSASASLEALLAHHKQPSKDTLAIAYMANHEEIGSRTYSGADSHFFMDVLKRIFEQQPEYSHEAFSKCLARSSALSLDGSHAFDPKNADQFEPRHTPHLGEGVSVKVDTGAAYCYSHALLASIQLLAKKNQIQIQNYLKRGDQRQGSTLGPLFVQKTSIPTLDMGCAQLSMHSAREVASLRDYQQLVKLSAKFLKM